MLIYSRKRDTRTKIEGNVTQKNQIAFGSHVIMNAVQNAIVKAYYEGKN